MRRSLLGALVALVSLVHATVPNAALARRTPCVMQASDRWQYVDFMGPWERHGMALEVDPRGCGTLSRGDGVAQPFAVTTFVLDAHAAATASGHFVNSPDTADGRGTAVVLRLEDEGTLTVERNSEALTFCRPWAWDPRCGA